MLFMKFKIIFLVKFLTIPVTACVQNLRNLCSRMLIEQHKKT